jgi:DNA-binding MarR family transcriptional regulator
MIDKKQLWSLAQETMQAFAPFYREATRKATQDSGAPDNWFGLRLARGSDPAPFTVEHFHAMFPYTAPKQFAQTLEELAQLKLLETAGKSAYRLTDRGREAVEGIFRAAHQALGTIEPLPADEMDQLNSLLYRLVEATLEAPEPEDKWAIAYSRWTDPGEDASGAAKADQYLTDLVFFRDDAHIAAWKPYGVGGHAWEALTFVWRDEASTADELAERLPYRSHTVEDYQEALQDLADRGWVVEESGVYKLTDKGRQVREAAEEETDRYFYIGWSALSEDELKQLQDLLARTNENLQAATLEQLWSLAREASQGIFLVTRDVVTPLVEKHGLDAPGFVPILLSVRRFAPDLVSADRLAIRGPYTNPAQYEHLLAGLTKAGYMMSRGDGEFEITERGRAALQEVEHAFYTRLGEVPVLSAEDLAQLESLLQRVGEASLEAQEPASKWCISTTHQGHPSQVYAPLAKIDQHLDDLNAFRDDVHLAAWEPYDVSGHAWEAFTFIWRSEASTAEELVEKLPYRGYTVEVYTEALEDLVDRRWVEETSDGYRVTEKGNAIRQDAEDATDRYFLVPWACLTASEKIQLHDLLTRLKNELQELAADKEGTT